MDITLQTCTQTDRLMNFVCLCVCMCLFVWGLCHNETCFMCKEICFSVCMLVDLKIGYMQKKQKYLFKKSEMFAFRIQNYYSNDDHFL